MKGPQNGAGGGLGKALFIRTGLQRFVSAPYWVCSELVVMPAGETVVIGISKSMGRLCGA